MSGETHKIRVRSWLITNFLFYSSSQNQKPKTPNPKLSRHEQLNPKLDYLNTWKFIKKQDPNLQLDYWSQSHQIKSQNLKEKRKKTSRLNLGLRLNGSGGVINVIVAGIVLQCAEVDAGAALQRREEGRGYERHHRARHFDWSFFEFFRGPLKNWR